MRPLITCLFLSLFFSHIQALPTPGNDLTWSPAVSMTAGLRVQDDHVSLQQLVENTTETPPQPESGSLVIPGEDEEEQKEKQCLNVCKKWGENCIINPRTGNRDCRRTCKEFGMECF
ncbi:MAG: hypothetical protein ACRESK_02530 [Gammaproteobacteria bacterium]